MEMGKWQEKQRKGYKKRKKRGILDEETKEFGQPTAVCESCLYVDLNGPTRVCVCVCVCVCVYVCVCVNRIE